MIDLESQNLERIICTIWGKSKQSVPSANGENNSILQEHL